MSHVGMAMNAVHTAAVRAEVRVLGAALCCYFRNHSFMAIHAVVVQHFHVFGAEPDGFVKIL